MLNPVIAGKETLAAYRVRRPDGLWTAIGRIIDLFTPTECANYFKAAGYDPDPT